MHWQRREKRVEQAKDVYYKIYKLHTYALNFFARKEQNKNMLLSKKHK